MVISRVIIRVTLFRALITLLITYLLSPLSPQVTDVTRCTGVGYVIRFSEVYRILF